ncbi:hypothetical protein Csa_015238, partial [Cucumis sativus]
RGKRKLERGNGKRKIKRQRGKRTMDIGMEKRKMRGRGKRKKTTRRDECCKKLGVLRGLRWSEEKCKRDFGNPKLNWTLNH